MTYEQITAIVEKYLTDEDYRGGPMQREYPPAVREGIADGIANDVLELQEHPEGE